MKRLLALLLCLVMALSLIPAAAAEDIELIDIEDPEETVEPAEELITIVDPEEPAAEPTGGEAVPVENLAIVTQPKSLKIHPGGTAKFTVEAIGACTYQWYFRTGSSGSWKECTVSSAKLPTLVYTNVSAAKSGNQYRCKVIFSETNYKYTNAVTLTVTEKPIITAQPQDLTIKAGADASFTVEADGADSYQWYWRENSEDSWHKATVSTATKATLVYKNLSTAKSGRQYKCAVKNSKGTTYSSVATLTVTNKPIVTQQPLDYWAGAGAKIIFRVYSKGTESYQWQYRTSSTGSWKSSSLSGNKTSALTVSATTARNGYQYRCKLTNASGTTYSAPATLTVTNEQCGDDLTWKLSGSGLLTISGTGDMWDFEQSFYADGVVANMELEDDAPWQALNVTRAVVGEGVTTIGTYAFHCCSNMKSITIPSTVKTIGEYAFESCSVLKSISLPSGLTSIGVCAFAYCYSLTSLTIPDSVTTVDSRAFYGCKNLKKVTLGKGVDSSVATCFRFCDKLSAFSVSAENTKITAVDGVLFTKTKKTLLRYPGAKEGAYTVPSTVTKINEEAFYSAVGLTSLTIPSSVTKIGDAAFAYSSVSSVTIKANITKIGDEWFRECKNLKSFTIPDGVTHIGWSAFLNSGLTSITIPDGVTVINNSAFEGTALTEITIPDSVITIGYSAFRDCTSLKKATVADGVKFLEAYSFANTALTEFTFPTSAIVIYDHVFLGCKQLKTVRIPVNIEEIDYDAFEDCTALKNVYYAGTQAQWEKIKISESGNEYLLSATMHYNS
ncbi:MAG: leucine-rich repeat protein [Oscillospiraceae bacterium]|nr:leucine-rich repeat protein [Oscillospiraceae bacterium]